MDTTIDSVRLAKDLIRFQEAGNPSAIIKRFPSPENLVIVNPFILEMHISSQHIKMALSFDEYPASSFPKVIFRDIPSCSVHSHLPHPNVNLLTGSLEIRPGLNRRCIRVNHAINFVRFILLNPLHYQGSCLVSQPNEPPRLPMPAVPAVALPEEPTRPQPNTDTPSFMEQVKNLGAIFTVIKTGLEIGNVFATLIGL